MALPDPPPLKLPDPPPMVRMAEPAPVYVVPPGTPPGVIWMMTEAPWQPIPQTMPCPPGQS